MARQSRFSFSLYTGLALVFSQGVAADEVINDKKPQVQFDQCKINEQDTENSDSQTINVEADNLEVVEGKNAKYTGDVVVTQGLNSIVADSVTVDQSSNIVTAEGNVNFSNGEIKTISDKATNDLNSEEIVIEQTQYSFLCESGRGEAAYIKKTGQALYRIEDGSITSCPEGDNAWRLTASSIDIDQNEDEATFYNPVLQVLDVPVFYLPYLTVPIGDTRKTGFLYPLISYDTINGVEITIPVYWNLAPNYDLETEFKYMENRGTQFNGKFRYLTSAFGKGALEYEYLNEDALNTEYGERWGFQYTHSGIFNNNWKLSADYSEVSDISYFSDFDSDLGTRSDGQLVQEASLSYRDTNWDATLLVRDFQLLLDDDSDTQPYRMMPQLAFNYYKPDILPYVNFDTISHITNFKTDESGKPSAIRVHVEPGLTVPLSTPWGTLTTEARLLSSYYDQDLDGVSSDDYEETVVRTLPQFRSHLGLVLERETTLLDGYTQTLEPQFQYLYIPHRDQSAIYSEYDTTLLQTDYYGLFRSRRYSSVDYIAEANQISFGASNRFYDENNKERMNISFGQILYLDGASNDGNNNSYSAWALESDFNYADNLFFHGSLQYDVTSSNIQLGNTSIEYQFNKGTIQGNYRYVSLDYIEDTVGETLTVDELTEEGISQAGLYLTYKLSDRWNTKSQYYYDLTTDKTLEWQSTLTYHSDCWYIGFTFSRELTGWSPNFQSYPDADAEYENNYGINFGIVGFGTNGVTGSSYSTGSSSIGYTRPFFLNN
ncbi:LPS assembly protein LptD [Vibrio sp. WJH972]